MDASRGALLALLAVGGVVVLALLALWLADWLAVWRWRQSTGRRLKQIEGTTYKPGPGRLVCRNCGKPWGAGWGPCPCRAAGGRRAGP